MKLSITFYVILCKISEANMHLHFHDFGHFTSQNKPSKVVQIILIQQAFENIQIRDILFF